MSEVRHLTETATNSHIPIHTPQKLAVPMRSRTCCSLYHVDDDFKPHGKIADTNKCELTSKGIVKFKASSFNVFV